MKLLKIVVLAAVCALSNAPVGAQTPAPKTNIPNAPEAAVSAQLENLLGAVRDDDYAGFMVSVDEVFKTALTKDAFETVVKTLGPRLKLPYKTTYFGQLQQNGYDVHLWKIHWETDDDMLAEMSVENEKIGGFFLR